MRRLRTVLGVDYNKITREKWDKVLIISGFEGIGKSDLGLHVTEIWYGFSGVCTGEHIVKVSMSLKDFASSLRDAERYDCLDFDEAGELSNKRTMERFNYLITRGYQVIRNERLLTILIIPDPFEINPYFLKRRARGLIVVYKRGKIAYWNRSRIRAMVDLNANRYRKTPWVVRPLFYDTYSIYNGVLRKPYDKMKDKHTMQVRKQLYNEMYRDVNKDELLEALHRAKKILDIETIMEIFGISKKTIYNRLRKYNPM